MLRTAFTIARALGSLSTGSTKAAVDLDQMDGELPEQAQRGVTGTEVVESDPNTEVGQLAQFRCQCVARSDQGGLGDFQVEALRTQPGRRQRPGDIGGEACTRELAGRDVDRDPALGHQARGVVRGVLAGLHEHPAAQRPDETTALRQLQEAVRGKQTVRAVLPPHERLMPHELQSAELHDGLIEGPELARAQGHPQVVLELQVRPGRHPVDARVERDVPGPSGALGPQQRHVGPHEDLVGGVRVGADATAEAQGDRMLVAPEVERFVERLGHAQGDLGQLRRRTHPLHDDHELVSANPAEQVLGSQGDPQPLGHLRQQAVARRVAQAVIDDLEPIHVAVQDADPAPRAILERTRQPLTQSGSGSGRRSARRAERGSPTPAPPHGDW